MISETEQSLTKQIWEDLGLTQAPKEEQGKALEIISQHLNKVIVVTLLRLLNPQQKERFKQGMKNSVRLQDTVLELSSEVPGLSDALEAAMQNEYEILKTLLSDKPNN